MLVRIDEEKAVEMLVERVSYWTQDGEVIAEEYEAWNKEYFPNRTKK